MKIQKEKEKFDRDMERSRREIEEGKLYDEKMLEKYKVDVNQRVYKKVKVKEIHINQKKNEGYVNLSSMLPIFDQ